MKGSDSKEGGCAPAAAPDAIVVTDPAAADLLVDPVRRRWLEPFLQREHTLGSAAAALGVAPSTLHYRLRRLLALGLLTRVRSEARAGMASPVYRASARAFFVPFARTSAESLEALAWEERLPLLRTLVARLTAIRHAHGDGWGLRVERVGGTVRVEFCASEPEADGAGGAPPIVDLDVRLRLDRRAAADLAAALERLTRESEARAARGGAAGDEGEPWLLHIGFVPLGE